jgi:hypothetical protein
LVAILPVSALLAAKQCSDGALCRRELNSRVNAFRERGGYSVPLDDRG